MDKDAERSVIGADLQIKGEVSSEGAIWVHGRLEGTIEAKTVVVESDGVIDGTVSTDQLVIAGTVKGEVNARSVEIKAGAEVRADVHHDQISVASGAVLLGQIKRRTGSAQGGSGKAAKPSAAE